MSTGEDALRAIREKLDQVLVPLADVEVHDVKIAWDPTTGASVDVHVSGQPEPK